MNMNQKTHPGLVTKLSLMVALATGFSMQANAAVVSIDSVVVDARALTVGNPADISTVTYIPPSTARATASSTNNDTDSYTYANASGAGLFNNFNAAATAVNTGSSSSSYTGKFTVTNDLATVQSVSLTSTLDRGRIRFFVTDPSGSGNSSMSWEVLVNGTVRNSASASLVYTQATGFNNVQPTNLESASFFTNGSGLALVSWESTDLVTDLGNLDPGASLSIELRLVANAISAFDSVIRGGNCYGYGEAFSEAPCTQPGGSIGTSFGDPGDLNGGTLTNAITSVPAAVGNVPLPGTVALLGLGLLAFGRARKKTA
jgi:hypothetical protein